MTTEIMYDVDAGRWEPEGDRNYKYSSTFLTLDEAVAAYQKCKGYPWAVLSMRMVIDDEPCNTVYVFGKETYWQDVFCVFNEGRINWTQAYEELMSRVGMTQEEALCCLAEHFDQRAPIEALPC